MNARWHQIGILLKAQLSVLNIYRRGLAWGDKEQGSIHDNTQVFEQNIPAGAPSKQQDKNILKLFWTWKEYRKRVLETFHFTVAGWCWGAVMIVKNIGHLSHTRLLLGDKLKAEFPLSPVTTKSKIVTVFGPSWEQNVQQEMMHKSDERLLYSCLYLQWRSTSVSADYWIQRQISDISANRNPRFYWDGHGTKVEQLTSDRKVAGLDPTPARVVSLRTLCYSA